jgi:hypothetical protein
MLRTSGRRIDMSQPFVDATMPDGSRLHVVIPDITRRHMAVNIRKFVLQAHHLDELVALGTLTSQAARFLEAAVASGLKRHPGQARRRSRNASRGWRSDLLIRYAAHQVAVETALSLQCAPAPRCARGTFFPWRAARRRRFAGHVRRRSACLRSGLSCPVRRPRQRRTFDGVGELLEH